MTFVEARNELIERLNAHLGIMFVLADDVQPELSFPYAYYSVITPGNGIPGMGNVTTEIRDSVDDDGKQDVFSVLHNMPIKQLSITFCSTDRVDNNGNDIFGEDEAVTLCEQAKNYLQHVGYHELSDAGLVVVEILNIGQRSGLVVNEVNRRYGFDVRIRFAQASERNDLSIDKVTY